MNDLLPELQNNSKSLGLNLELQPDQITDDDKHLIQFIAKTQLIRKYLNHMEEQTQYLIQINDELLNLAGPKQKERINEIDILMDESKEDQQKIKFLMDDLNKFINERKSDDPDGKSSQTRIFTNLNGALVKIFSDKISVYQKYQSEIKSKLQSGILREAEIVLGRKLENGEVEKVLNQQGYVQKALADKLGSTGHVKLQNAVADIEERYQDIINLEKSVNQVHILFQELAALTTLQGELIDNIESNISNAKEHVLEAEVNLKKSKENIESARKKKCCILMIVMVILVIIVLPIMGVKFF